MSYREKIYQRYAEGFQIKGYARSDVAKHWALAYQYFLRNWLPAEKSSRIADVGCGGGAVVGRLPNLGI